MQRERGGDGLRFAREILHLEHNVAARAQRSHVKILHVATDHRLRERGGRGFARAPRRDRHAVTQNGVAIGERLHLLEKMRDVNDRTALVAQPAHERGEFLRVGLRKAARRFVEHEHAATQRERAGDLDELLRRDAELSGGHIERDVGPAELRERLRRDTARLGVTQDTTARGFGAEHDVFDDGEMRRDRELLIHHHDTRATRVGGIARRERLTIELHLSGIRRVHAGENSHERALAGAVFADERVHFACGNLEFHTGERNRSAEALANSGEAQAGNHERSRWRGISFRARP